MPLCLTLPSNHELTPIVKASKAQPQDEKDENNDKVYTGLLPKLNTPASRKARAVLDILILYTYSYAMLMSLVEAWSSIWSPAAV